MDEAKCSRRQWIRNVVAGAGSALVVGSTATASARFPPPTSSRKRVLRIAQLADVHVQPEAPAPAGLAACLRHIQGLPDPPDFLLNTGDAVMDALEQDDARTAAQWDVWSRVLRQECSLPIEHCVGNHDVWGLNRARSRTTGGEPLYGKLRALDALGLNSPYRSFDRAGWHFIILDSTFIAPGGYAARLDEEQFAWLAEDLARTSPTAPAMIVSHIPILSAAAFFGCSGEANGCYWVPAYEMHSDFRRLKDLFKRHPNVRLALSGHLHLHERVDYLDVTYLCGGAVSGDWWKGSFLDCDPGYTLIDLFDDGSFAHAYVTYGATPG